MAPPHENDETKADAEASPGPGDAPVTPAGADAVDAPADGSPLIMIVDNDISIIELTKWRLSLDGYDRFLTTTDSTQALKLIIENRPDVLLLDLVMPGVTGLDLIEQVREINELRELPIIVMTASHGEESMRTALALGATDFLNKSVDPSEMVAHVRNALSFNAHRSRIAKLVALLEEEFKRRMNVEVQLVRAKRAADAANRAKTEFLANMSHEIRTPLTAILGYAELLQDGGLAPRDRAEAVTTILQNGNALVDLVNDLLDFSRLETGRLETHIEVCALASLIGSVEAAMRIRAEANALALRVTVQSGIPETILTDERRVRQILFNLIGNAIKFTQRGSVEVRLDLAPRAPADGALLQIDVVDTGIGITQKQASRLFRPFTQVDSSAQRSFGGTGLGLSISRRLAAMLHGDVTLVRAEPDRGSHFRLTLPTGPLDGVRLITELTAPAQPITTSTHRRLQAAGSVRILLAEDGEFNQRLLHTILTKAGATVVIAENGREAVDQALAARERAEPFDLILMDIQMPILDGHQATRMLRAQGYDGPIVALTASALPSDRDRAIGAGCTDFLSKPIARDRLFDAVDTHCTGVATEG